MGAFQYTALNQQGKRKKGVLEADTARQVRQQLRDKGLTALEVNAVSDRGAKPKAGTEKKKSYFRFTRSKRMSSSDLCLVTRQMATLLAAGIPLDEVLSGVANQNEKAHVKSILLGVRAKVMEGHTLASGMADFPSAFPKLYRTTVSSGEKSGKLDKVLIRLAEYTEKQQGIKRKIRQAMIYPTLMSVVSVLVVVFMLIYVVPKIVDTFNQTNQVLPMVTTILLAISHITKEYGLYLVGAGVLLSYLFSRLMKKESFREKIHRLLLKTPLLGKSIRIVNSARFARTFGILNAASVPVLEAMGSAAQLISPLPMRRSVEKSVAQVREGMPISVSLQNTGYFSPMFVHLVASGESSGQLEEMLQRAAINQEADVEAVIDGALTLFEPVMILVMGAVVMFIVLAIMLPIFSLDQFSG